MATASDLTRRALLASAGAMLALDAPAQESVGYSEPALRSLVTEPIGCCLNTSDLESANFISRFSYHFSQITPGWEMKMAPLLTDNWNFRWEPVDKLIAFAERNGMRVHGHTLVWYLQKPKPFIILDGSGKEFSNAYRLFITTVAKRYRKRVSSWDTLNEPILPDGSGLRPSLWSSNLGNDGHIVQAFDYVRDCDPNAVQFINEYDLEARPEKRLAFMRLVEKMLKLNVPIGGIGSQTHIKIDLPKGAMQSAIRDLSTFGLPIHISELDISFGRRWPDLRSLEKKRELQVHQIDEVLDAYMNLPEKQRYALTWWGFSDRDSWLRMPPMNVNGGESDEPLAFDEKGKPKKLFWKMARRLKA